MLDRPVVLQAELERLYDRSDSDVDLARFVQDHDISDDDALAELIETDGRMRLARGRDVELDRYIQSITNLPGRDVPLDAAIDVALRAMSSGGRADQSAVRTLIDRYPQFEQAIREAGVLSAALVSTAGLRADMADRAVRDLPAEFGPGLLDGRARYELRELLGQGAFGQVYLATDRQLSEPGHPALVAIKILSVGDRTPWARVRLADEATKARRIDHSSVVRVVDRGVTAEDEDYIVHEFVGGGDLSEWLDNREGPIEPRLAADLVAQMARGVQAAHSAGLVHCDLKPGNIMLTSDGRPKVADFGIAARLDELPGAPPEDGEEVRPVGNLAFIAPEQYRREEGATTAPADIYALGGILFRLLTGRLPNGSSVEEIARTHDPDDGRRDAPSAAERAAGIDRDLDLICRRAMAPNAQERYPSAAILADDLEAWRRREPIPWTRPGPLRVARLWARRKPGLAVASGLVVLSIIAAELGIRHFLEKARVAQAREVALEEGAQQFVERGRRMMARGHRPASEILATIWFLGDVLGPDMFGAPGERTSFWRERIKITRLYIDNNRERELGNEVPTRLLELQLALWLVRDGDYEEVEPLMTDARAYWRGIASDQPYWLAIIDAVHDGAVVNRLVTEFADGAMSAEARGEAVEVEGSLLKAEALFAETERGSPIHHLVLKSLVCLYGPTVLDQPGDAVAFAALIRVLLDTRSESADDLPACAPAAPVVAS